MDFQISPLPPDYQNISENKNGGGLFFKKMDASAAKILKWLIILGVLLSIIAVVVFLFLRSPFNVDGIALEIEGPKEASVGEEITYKINYKNNTKTQVEAAKLTLFYPFGSIIFKDGKTSETLSDRFEIGNLESGDGAEKEIKVFLTGNRGDIKTAKAVLTFKPVNVRSEFQKEESASTTITSTPVSLTLVSPPDAVAGQRIELFLDYRNQTDDSIFDSRFIFNYPEGFEPDSFSPSPSQGGSIWDIPLIAKGRGGRIEIKGVISGGEKESKPFSVDVQRKIGEEFLTYQKASSNTVLTAAPLEISVLANNSVDYISFPGDTVEYLIKYANNSKQDLSGVTISTALNGSMFDFSTIVTDGFFDGNEKLVVWNASSVSQLGLLRPNGSGELKFKIKLKNYFPSSGVGSKDFFLKVAVAGTSSDNLFELSGGVVAKSELITRISSKPFVEQAGFVSGIFSSLGPVPPKMSQKTNYTVRWRIVNSGSDVLNSKITAVLPTGIKWENETRSDGTQARISFNESNRQIIWDLSVIPSKTGIVFPAIEGYFLISITPLPNQAGSTAVLLKDSKFEGTDGFTQQGISTNLGNITTGSVTNGGDGVIR